MQPPSQRTSQIRSRSPDTMAAASATRTAITKSLITSLAKCREGPENMSMNQRLPQHPCLSPLRLRTSITQSQTPDYDARRNGCREGCQYPHVARAKPRRLRPRWGHLRVGGRHCVAAWTTINVCSRLRYPWNSVHGGTSAKLSACRPIEFRGEPGGNGLRQRFFGAFELFTRFDTGHRESTPSAAGLNISKPASFSSHGVNWSGASTTGMRS